MVAAVRSAATITSAPARLGLGTARRCAVLGWLHRRKRRRRRARPWQCHLDVWAHDGVGPGVTGVPSGTTSWVTLPTGFYSPSRSRRRDRISHRTRMAIAEKDISTINPATPLMRVEPANRSTLSKNVETTAAVPEASIAIRKLRCRPRIRLAPCHMKNASSASTTISADTSLTAIGRRGTRLGPYGLARFECHGRNRPITACAASGTFGRT